jgi:hypothetical protein
VREAVVAAAAQRELPALSSLDLHALNPHLCVPVFSLALHREPASRQASWSSFEPARSLRWRAQTRSKSPKTLLA